MPTRHPSENLFDRVADEADFEALYALEAMTNERARDALGEIERVPRAQRRYGPGSGPIMAAFTHVNTEGSRFSAGAAGAGGATTGGAVACTGGMVGSAAGRTGPPRAPTPTRGRGACSWSARCRAA